MVVKTSANSGLWNNANNTKQVIVIHDTESGGAAGSYNWMKSQRNGSYHDLVDLNGDIYLMVPEDKQAWAAMNIGNRIGLHICATGYAAWSQQKWLSYNAMLEVMADIIYKWSVKYGIPLVLVSPSEIRAGKKGICTHADISNAFHESDHTDPGKAFPLVALVMKARARAGLDPKVVSDVWAQTWVWPQLANMSLVDAVSIIGKELEAL